MLHSSELTFPVYLIFITYIWLTNIDVWLYIAFYLEFHTITPNYFCTNTYSAAKSYCSNNLFSHLLTYFQNLFFFPFLLIIWRYIHNSLFCSVLSNTLIKLFTHSVSPWFLLLQFLLFPTQSRLNIFLNYTGPVFINMANIMLTLLRPVYYCISEETQNEFFTTFMCSQAICG